MSILLWPSRETVDAWCPGSEEQIESDTWASNRWLRLTASVPKQVVSWSAGVDDYNGNNICQCYKFVCGHVWGSDRFSSVHMELSLNQLRIRRTRILRNKVVKTIQSHPQRFLLTKNSQNWDVVQMG